jgi:hypothetical protein
MRLSLAIDPKRELATYYFLGAALVCFGFLFFLSFF